MSWFIFAICASIAFAIQSEVNKHYKIDGFVLNTVQCVISVLLLAPFIPFMEWPGDPMYYLITLLCAAMSVVSAMALYNLAANKSGRVACLYQPIAVLLVFLIWLAFDQAQRLFLIENPWNALAIAFAFGLYGISIQFIRRNDIGWRVLLAVLPIAVLFSIGVILTKIILAQGESPLRITLNFVFLLCIFGAVISLPLLLSKHMKSSGPVLNKHVFKGAAWVAVFHTLSWILFNVAIVLSPNPAYVSMVDGLIPVWFMLYYRLRGFHDDASPRSGLIITLAAVILLLATS